MCIRDSLGGDQTLHHRVVGQVQVHDHMVGDAALLEGTAEKFSHVVLDAHGGEYDGKLPVVPRYMGLAHHLGGQFVVGHAGTGEDRQLLPPDQGGGAVDGGDAGVKMCIRDR